MRINPSEYRTDLVGDLPVVRMFQNLKFAVFEEISLERSCIAHIFSSRLKHADVVASVLERYRDRLGFVGAGILIEHLACWESSSCVDEYSYDRPRDVALAKALLDELVCDYMAEKAAR